MIASQQSIVRQPEVEVSVRSPVEAHCANMSTASASLLASNCSFGAKAEGAKASWLLLLLLLPSLRRRAARGRSSSGRALAVPNRRADVDEAREIMRAVIMLCGERTVPAG